MSIARQTIERAIAGSKSRRTWILAAAILAWIFFISAIAATAQPWYDEGLLANPAWNLAHRGVMATTGLPDPIWPHVDRYTFNTLPGGILAAAAAFRLFGCFPFTARIPQMIFAVAGIFAIFRIVQLLTGDSARALIASALVALDFTYIVSATSARVDMMTFALGLLAQVAYLTMREANLRLALFTCSALLTGALLTHPAAIFPIVWTAMLALSLDRNRLNTRSVLLALLPPLLGGIAWAAYLSQDPASAWAQLSSNAIAHKTLLSLSELRESVREEFRFRYLRRSPAVPGVYFPKALLAALYLAGTLLAFFRAFRPGAGADRFFLACLLFSAGFLTFLDAEKFQLAYLLYVSPLCLILCSGAISRQGPFRWPFTAFAAITVLISAAGFVGPIRDDNYHRDYLRAAKTLQSAARPDQMVLAPVPWFFAYGLDGARVRWLNVRSWPSQAPDFVVSAASEPLPGLFEGWRAQSPAAYEELAAHARFDLIYQSPSWLVYQRKP